MEAASPPPTGPRKAPPGITRLITKQRDWFPTRKGGVYRSECGRRHTAVARIGSCQSRYFFNNALASFNSAWPLAPLALTSLIQESSTDSVAFTQRLYSASLNTLIVFFLS